jgi:hypothetical protein
MNKYLDARREFFKEIGKTYDFDKSLIDNLTKKDVKK